MSPNPREISPTIVPNPANGTPCEIQITEDTKVKINEEILVTIPKKPTTSKREYELARIPLNAYLKVALLLAFETPWMRSRRGRDIPIDLKPTQGIIALKNLFRSSNPSRPTFTFWEINLKVLELDLISPFENFPAMK